jgi:serine/threonine protein kinase
MYPDQQSTRESIFTTAMNPLFIRSQVSDMPKVANLLLSDRFTLYTRKDKQTSIRVYCELWDHVIIIKEGQNKKTIGFMDVSYSRLKLTISPEEKKLRLIKNKKYEELWSDDEEVLNRWYQTLGRFCIYSSFRTDYRVHELLGKGNFAKVYLAEDLKSLQKYAVKVYCKEQIQDDPFELKCFLYETTMMQRVDGPHLLRVSKIFEGDSNIYCLGEYYSGGSLQKYLEEHGRPTASHAVSIIKQLLQALAYLDAEGLIHRDIKPDNIMFKDRSCESIALVDLGFMTRKSDFKKLFTRCGTPGYVAPEVLADADYDQAVDVYSAGIIFYLMLSKVNPFMDQSYRQLIRNNKSGVVDFSVFNEIEIDRKPKSRPLLTLVLEVLQLMLTKNPAKRPRASELLKYRLFCTDIPREDVTEDSPTGKGRQSFGLLHKKTAKFSLHSPSCSSLQSPLLPKIKKR